jgi:integrase
MAGICVHRYVATTEQVWQLYELFPERMRLAVLLGAFVGLRLAEACGLRIDDIDFSRAVIHPKVQYPARRLKTKISQTPHPGPGLTDRRVLRPDQRLWASRDAPDRRGPPPALPVGN